MVSPLQAHQSSRHPALFECLANEGWLSDPPKGRGRGTTWATARLKIDGGGRLRIPKRAPNPEGPRAS